MRIPQQVGFLPYRLHLNTQETRFRPDYAKSIVLAIPAYLVSIPVVFLSGLPIAGTSTISVYFLSAAAAVLWCIVSSFQDHVRLCLHAVEAHWAAAIVSITNCAIMAVVVIAMVFVPGIMLADPYFPFLALALSNLVSAGIGVLLSMRFPQFSELPEGKTLARSKYLVSDLAVQGTGYVAMALVSVMLGVSAVANLEAARIAAQPVFILAAALGSIVTPRIIRAFGAGNFPHVKRLGNLMTIGSTALGAAYSVLVWAASGVIGVILDRHFDAPLAAARSASSAMQTVAGNLNPLYYISGNARRLNFLTGLSSLIGLVVLVVGIPVVGVYSLPICFGVAAAIRVVFVQLDLRRRLTGNSSQS